jgi:hypothetical protein
MEHAMSSDLTTPCKFIHASDVAAASSRARNTFGCDGHLGVYLRALVASSWRAGINNSAMGCAKV